VWSNPQRYDVMIYAHPSRTNVLAIEGVNLQNQAGYDRGIVADLRFTIDGAAQTVTTGAGFAATNTLTAGWEQPGFDDSAWPPAFELGAVGIAPWGAVLASLAPGSTAQWIWTYDPAANPNKPTVESTYARRRFTTVDPRCPVTVE
jgi:alpha-L-rhamnosidase